MKLSYKDFDGLDDDNIVIKSYILITEHLLSEKLKNAKILLSGLKVEILDNQQLLDLTQVYTEKEDQESTFTALAIYYYLYNKTFQHYIYIDEQNPQEINEVYANMQIVYCSIRNILDLEPLKADVGKYLQEAIQQIQLISNDHPDKELQRALMTLLLHYQQEFASEDDSTSYAQMLSLMGSDNENQLIVTLTLQLRNVTNSITETNKLIDTIIDFEKGYQDKDKTLLRDIVRDFLLRLFENQEKALLFKDFPDLIKKHENSWLREIYNTIKYFIKLDLYKAKLFFAMEQKTENSVTMFNILILQCSKEFSQIEDYADAVKNLLFETIAALYADSDNLSLYQSLPNFLNKYQQQKLSEWASLHCNVGNFRIYIQDFHTSPDHVRSFLSQFCNYYEKHEFNEQAKSLLETEIDKAYENLLKIYSDHIEQNLTPLTEADITLYINLPNKIGEMGFVWANDLADCAQKSLEYFYKTTKMLKKQPDEDFSQVDNNLDQSVEQSPFQSK